MNFGCKTIIKDDVLDTVRKSIVSNNEWEEMAERVSDIDDWGEKELFRMGELGEQVQKGCKLIGTVGELMCRAIFRSLPEDINLLEISVVAKTK